MRRCVLRRQAVETTTEGVRALKARDITLTVPCNKGTCRLTFCSTRHLLRDVIQRHQLLEVTRAHTPFWQMLGTNLSFTNLLASQHDGEERVSTRFTVNEATIAVEAMALGECRAHLQKDYNQQLMSQKKDPFPLRVDRVLYNQPQAFSSHVNANLDFLIDLQGDPPAAAEDDRSPPHALFLKGMDAASLQAYYHYNMTLHAYHFLRQSDGVVPAMWLHTGIKRKPLVESGLLEPLDNSRLTETGRAAVRAGLPADAAAHGSEASQLSQQLYRALEQSVASSFGLMITPLAAGGPTERAMWHLQQLLVRGVTASQVTEVEEEARELTKCPTLHSLLQEDDFHLYACQTVLSIVTGDVEKSSAVAEKARQCTRDPSRLAEAVQSVRKELRLEEAGLQLDLEVDQASRCAVDFFCRCSPTNFVNALKTLPEETYQAVYQKPFRCSLCTKRPAAQQGYRLVVDVIPFLYDSIAAYGRGRVLCDEKEDERESNKPLLEMALSDKPRPDLLPCFPVFWESGDGIDTLFLFISLTHLPADTFFITKFLLFFTKLHARSTSPFYFDRRGKLQSCTIQSLKARDITLTVPCNKGTCRLTFCSTRHLLRDVIQRHQLLEVTRAHTPFWQMLGTNLSFTNLLASQHDGEERVSTRFTVNEATIAVEAMALGECRAHIEQDYNQTIMDQGTPPFRLTVDRTLHDQPVHTAAGSAGVIKLLNYVDDLELVMALRRRATPYPLCVQGMDRNVLQAYYNYNMTLHAYHFLRQSDGVVPAMWLHTRIKRQPLIDAGMVNPEEVLKLTKKGATAVRAGLPADAAAHGSEASQLSQQLYRALEQSVASSFGLMITPLAAGGPTERAMWHLQQLLVRGVTASEVSDIRERSTEITCPTLHSLLQEDDFHLYACQTVLSIVTGDVDRSFTVAQHAQQCTRDPAEMAPLIETIRQELRLDEVAVPIELGLDGATRSHVHFACRCSPANFLRSIRKLPDDAYKQLYKKPFRCSLCRKTHAISDKIWAALSEARQLTQADVEAPVANIGLFLSVCNCIWNVEF
eukprot:gene5907-4222_t